MQRIDNQMQPKMSVLASTFAAKYSSKRECFNFLSVDCQAYLCSHDTLTTYFLKDLMSGKKKCKTEPLHDFANVFRHQVLKCLLSILSTVQRLKRP